MSNDIPRNCVPQKIVWEKKTTKCFESTLIFSFWTLRAKKLPLQAF